MLVTHGSLIFAGPPNVMHRPVSSPIELFPGQRLAIDYQTAAAAEFSALETCVAIDIVVKRSHQASALCFHAA